MQHNPQMVSFQTADEKWHALQHEGNHWRSERHGVTVELSSNDAERFSVILQPTTEPLLRIRLDWPNSFTAETQYLGDAFERAYGDLGFKPLDEERVFYWYLIAKANARHCCYGVATQPSAFCAWITQSEQISLWLDIRSGTEALHRPDSSLNCCTVIMKDYLDLDDNQCLKNFTQQMHHHESSDTIEPMIGTNDWYYAYGNNDKRSVLANTRELVKLTQGLSVKPWTVIDDGWQVAHTFSYNGGPWNAGNEKFGDMSAVATEIKNLGARPGLWFRPLLMPSDTSEYGATLDISDPETLAQVRSDIQRFRSWGFELIKYDFSCFDVLGNWGREMGLNYFAHPVHFTDSSLTSAEVIKTFYQVIRTAAGDCILIGCNTISHLCAGLVDLMRIGDDVSGMSFHRTVAMGVNSLGYRLPQHGIFYQADADCVPITQEVEWENTENWLSVMALSGTPLLVSCDFTQLNTSQRLALSKAFALTTNQKMIRPKSLIGRYPTIWFDRDREYQFEWDFDPLQPI